MTQSGFHFLLPRNNLVPTRNVLGPQLPSLQSIIFFRSISQLKSSVKGLREFLYLSRKGRHWKHSLRFLTCQNLYCL